MTKRIEIICDGCGQELYNSSKSNEFIYYPPKTHCSLTFASSFELHFCSKRCLENNLDKLPFTPLPK